MMPTQESTSRLCPFPVVPPKAKLLERLQVFTVEHKFLVTAGTMAVSVACYAPFFGIPMAVGVSVLLLLHELGHILALNKRGYACTSPIFVPFLGAIVFSQKIDSLDDEAFMAYGGPLVGGVFAILLFQISLHLSPYTWFGYLLFRASYVGVLINLFNLLPLAPLDGGAVTQAIGPRFKYVGFVALVVLTVIAQAPVLLFVWMLVVMTSPTMSARLQAILSVVLWIAMTVLMIPLQDGTPILFKVITCALALPFVWWSVRQGIRNQPRAPVVVRTPLPFGKRIYWLVLYVGLVALLAGVLLTQRHTLP